MSKHISVPKWVLARPAALHMQALARSWNDITAISKHLKANTTPQTSVSTAYPLSFCLL